MLTQLPAEVLGLIVARVGPEPDHLFRTCRAIYYLSQDDRALVQWLQLTFGAHGAISSLMTLRCVAGWEEARILEAMQQLLKHGCTMLDSAQAGNVLYWATERCLPRVLQVLLAHVAARPVSGGTSLKTWLNSLLKTASCRGHEACVRVLLQQGADPNVDGGRPLKAAIEAACHVGCARALLDAGADLHAGAECALRMCAAAGSPPHLQLMAMLLERGADVHAKMDEALSLAVERCNAAAVELLLSHGANANARHVLEIASSTGSARIVQLLLQHGAAPDEDGGRPLRAAAGAGAVEVVRLLLDASIGARRSGCSTLHQPDAATSSSTTCWQLSRNSFDCTSRTRVQHPAAHLATSLPTQKVCLTAGAARHHRPGVCASHSSSSLGSSRSSSSDLQGAAAQHGGGAGEAESAGLLFQGDLQHLQEDDCGMQDSAVHAHFQLTPELQVGQDSRAARDGRGGMGSEALCAALCAGEDKVVSVLLERGACVDVEVLTCWRLWHRYPGSMALLQRHRLLHNLCPTPTAGCSTCVAAAAYPEDSYPRALKLKLEEVLIAAASEGAESAVELFLSWGSPQTDESMAACGRITATTAAALAAAAIAADPTQLQPDADPNSTAHASGCVQQHVLGLFSAKALAAALTAAAALNRHVVCGQLLRHQVGPVWQQVLMDPSALHAAVSAGHLDVARLLLQSGAGVITLQATAPPLAARANTSIPLPHSKPVQVASHRPAPLPPFDLILGSAARRSCPTVAPQPAAIEGCNSLVDDTAVVGGAAAAVLPASQVHAADTPGPGPAPSQPCNRSHYSLPPPPLQGEAWGTVVLCGAASCKAGCKAATALTGLLLEHGFGVHARDALRLVASGRVPPWRDEAATTILSAAFRVM